MATTSTMLNALRSRLDDRSAHVGVAGLGYVGLPLAVELTRAGFRVTGIDPDPPVPTLPVAGGRLVSTPRSAGALAEVDCVVVHTDHTGFDYPWIVGHARLVFDTRNAARQVTAGRDRVVRLQETLACER
jgi:UDP-N-acetyl-D-mannosaminuronate dehydrogenase